MARELIEGIRIDNKKPLFEWMRAQNRYTLLKTKSFVSFK